MLSEPMLALTDSRRSLPPPSTLKNALNLDFVWMLSLCHCVPNTPMSTGWNSRIVKDVLPLQRVRYLPQIDASPTRVDFVKETMERSLRILKECNQRYISGTYDLAIANQALCIQSMEKPIFNNFFIQLGSFHIFLSFFKAVGKFIAEFGAPYALTESEVLAAGSLNGFLLGTNYSRCNRIPPLFVVSLEILHFQAFIKKEDNLALLESLPRLLRSLKIGEKDRCIPSVNSN